MSVWKALPEALCDAVQPIAPRTTTHEDDSPRAVRAAVAQLTARDAVFVIRPNILREASGF